jgi:integrase
VTDFFIPQVGPSAIAFLTAVRRAGLEPLRFHDLRNSAVALAIKAGAHPKAIAERLGHASITTTLNTYGHRSRRWTRSLLGASTP